MARPTIDPHLSAFSAMNFARVRPEVSRSFTFPFLPLPLPFGGFEPGRTGRAPAGVSLVGTASRAAAPRGGGFIIAAGRGGRFITAAGRRRLLGHRLLGSFWDLG